MNESDQKKVAREIHSLVKRLDDVLWEMAESIQKEPKRSPEEMEALVDDFRNKIVPPISAFLRRNMAQAPIPQDSTISVDVKSDPQPTASPSSGPRYGRRKRQGSK